MKYFCENCKSIIDEQDLRMREDKGDFNNPPYNEEYCPNCGAEDLWETEECIWCGAIKPEYAYDKTMFCEDCKTEMEMWWNDTIDKFAERWFISRDKAIEIINEFLAETA